MRGQARLTPRPTPGPPRPPYPPRRTPPLPDAPGLPPCPWTRAVPSPASPYGHEHPSSPYGHEHGCGHGHGPAPRSGPARAGPAWAGWRTCGPALAHGCGAARAGPTVVDGAGAHSGPVVAYEVGPARDRPLRTGAGSRPGSYRASAVRRDSHPTVEGKHAGESRCTERQAGAHHSLPPLLAHPTTPAHLSEPTHPSESAAPTPSGARAWWGGEVRRRGRHRRVGGDGAAARTCRGSGMRRRAPTCRGAGGGEARTPGQGCRPGHLAGANARGRHKGTASRPRRHAGTDVREAGVFRPERVAGADVRAGMRRPRRRTHGCT